MTPLVFPTFILERDLRAMGFTRILGIDEVGMGSFAGPLTCCGVILHREIDVQNIRDSKTLSEKQRETVYKRVTKLSSVEYAIAHASSEEIDSLGLGKAHVATIQKVIDLISPPPDYLLIDGKYLAPFSVRTQYVTKGDRESVTLALASIIAKVTRDRMLKKEHVRYPQYNFKKNKGYGSKEHRKALMQYGPTPLHRKSYAPIAKLLQK